MAATVQDLDKTGKYASDAAAQRWSCFHFTTGKKASFLLIFRGQPPANRIDFVNIGRVEANHASKGHRLNGQLTKGRLGICMTRDAHA